MTVLRSAFVTLLALALLIAVPNAASAKFTRTAGASLSMTADTLAPPTNVKVTCNRGAGFVISWTITSDQYATGYTIIGSYFGSSSSVDVTGRTVKSYNYPSDVPSGTTIQIVSDFKNWTSAKSNAATVTC